MKKLIFLFLAVSSLGLHAGTFDEIVTIFQAKCGDCHGGNQPAAGLVLTGSASSIYANIVNVPAQNQWALSKGYKLVEKGFPDRSFLYRKINNGLYHDSELESTNAGEIMPSGYAPDLTNAEIELVRQWIFHDASQTSTVVSFNTLEQYYAGNGIEELERPTPPAAGEGFQLYLGKIFLQPGEEREIIYKYPLLNAEGFEVTRIETTMDAMSHHLLFFKDRDGSINQNNGFLTVTLLSGNSAITNDTKMIGGWANDGVLDLPQGTAYTWDANTILKYNFHLKNYSTTAILGSEVYMNVYTQPLGTAIKEMHADFFINTNFFDYFITPNVQKNIDYTVSGNAFESAPAGEPDSLYLFLLGGHTHKYGIDYDMWLRNADGSQGEQIYEGFYNVDYTVNQGYFAWEEPPTRIFSDGFAATTRARGLFTRGTYLNTGNSVVNFGLTTNDEMQGFFIQYLVGSIASLGTSGIGDHDMMIPSLSVYPNPTTDQLWIPLHTNDATLENISIYNANGQLVMSKVLDSYGVDNKGQLIDVHQLPKGFYVLVAQGANQSAKARFIKQ